MTGPGSRIALVGAAVVAAALVYVLLHRPTPRAEYQGWIEAYFIYVSPDEAAASPLYGGHRSFTFRRVEDLRARLTVRPHRWQGSPSRSYTAQGNISASANPPGCE